MKPIDIYARQSRLRDKDQTTTTSQVASCRAVLAERELPVGLVHEDKGKSAWDPKVTRLGWNALMDRLESGEAGGVIVYDLERFARQLADGERLVTAAERGLVVLDSEGSYDLRKAGDKKNFRNAIVAAEYYSDLLQAKVRRGKRAKAHSGQVDMRRSFGFEDDGITVLEDEAAIIRDHAERLLAGETQDALIRELNARGTGVRGARWGYTTYRQIMTRPRNIGLIVHSGEVVPGVRLPGEPILDSLTHDRLVALYESRKPGRQPSGRYLLTGIAGCPCGATLVGRPITGTPRKQYWCRKCSHTFVDAARLDDFAGDFAVRTLADPQHADALDRAERELSERRGELEAEHAAIGATLDALTEKLAPPVSMPFERYNRAAKPMEDRQREIEAELADLATAEPEPILPGVRTLQQADPCGYSQISWLEEWDQGSTADRRAMVLRALNGRRMVIGRGRAATFDPARVTIA
jgi:site-specific DNA recombinase